MCGSDFLDSGGRLVCEWKSVTQRAHAQHPLAHARIHRKAYFSSSSHSKGALMPLARIDLLAGKTPEYRAQVGEIVYQALLECFGVPQNDRFQVIAEHRKADFVFDRDYLGVHRSDDCI